MPAYWGKKAICASRASQYSVADCLPHLSSISQSFFENPFVLGPADRPRRWVRSFRRLRWKAIQRVPFKAVSPSTQWMDKPWHLVATECARLQAAHGTSQPASLTSWHQLHVPSHAQGSTLSAVTADTLPATWALEVQAGVRKACHSGHTIRAAGAQSALPAAALDAGPPAALGCLAGVAHTQLRQGLGHRRAGGGQAVCRALGTVCLALEPRWACVVLAGVAAALG
jgi:hypothetical protein